MRIGRVDSFTVQVLLFLLVQIKTQGIKIHYAVVLVKKWKNKPVPSKYSVGSKGIVADSRITFGNYAQFFKLIFRFKGFTVMELT
ncbi:hypothetical protein D3C87_1962230 [compost metagenome]